MDDYLEDADCRKLSEVPASAATCRVFLVDARQAGWIADIHMTADVLLIRFPCRPDSGSPLPPDDVFGLEASFHSASCTLAWVTVPQKYRRRKLAGWMVAQLAHECARRNIAHITGAIEPNDEALPFWLSLSPELHRSGKPVNISEALHRRGVRFTLDVASLLARPLPVSLLSEDEFAGLLQRRSPSHPKPNNASDVVPQQNDPCSVDPFWLYM